MGAISPPPSSWMSKDNKSGMQLVQQTRMETNDETLKSVHSVVESIGKRSAFPNILYDILNNAESMEYSDIVSFLPHGRAFIICDRANFEELVIPRFFGHKSFISFRA